MRSVHCGTDTSAMHFRHGMKFVTARRPRHRSYAGRFCFPVLPPLEPVALSLPQAGLDVAPVAPLEP
jgi:hypothetical protein